MKLAFGEIIHNKKGDNTGRVMAVMSEGRTFDFIETGDDTLVCIAWSTPSAPQSVVWYTGADVERLYGEKPKACTCECYCR